MAIILDTVAFEVAITINCTRCIITMQKKKKKKLLLDHNIQLP